MEFGSTSSKKSIAIKSTSPPHNAFSNANENWVFFVILYTKIQFFCYILVERMFAPDIFGATFVFLVIAPNDLFDNKEAPYETPFFTMASRQLAHAKFGNS